MIAQAALLFLCGTTLTSAQFFPRMSLPSRPLNGCPSGPELAPIICKFMQPNMPSQFKPQLIAPTTYIAPLVIEKCDTPQLHIELPEPVEEFKPMVIPEAPELPPLMIPKFPVPVIIEDLPQPLPEPCESEDIAVMPMIVPAAPELPPLEIHEIPKIEMRPEPCLNEVIPEIHLNTIELEPISVPQPPELPAFVMPEIPVHVEPVVPCLDDELVPAPIPAYVEPLVPLPAAPELPEFVMPELPLIEVVQPELPIAFAPCLEDEPIPALIPEYVEPIAPLPAAPELPEFIMPELPVIEVVQPELPIPVAPCLEDEPIPAPIPMYVEPIAPLPAAPELPPFVMPELPTPVIQPELPIPTIPCAEDEQISFVPIPALRQPFPEYNMVDYEPVPQAPELPAFVMPEMPIYIAEAEPAAPCLEDLSAPVVAMEEIQPLAPMPAAPELPPATLPELPLSVEVPMAPVMLAEPEPCLPEERPMIVPQPLAWPEIKMPELPVRVAIEEPAPCEPAVMPNPFYQKLFPNLITIYNEKAKETQNILLPSQPIESPPCVYNLVMKHVMPNMFSNNFRSMENIEIQPAPFVPCV